MGQPMPCTEKSRLRERGLEAAGVFASIEEASARMVRPERTFEPNRALKGHYDEGFGRYTELYARLKGFDDRQIM
jgi:sugar (pentulose or hexulose) kinase